MTETNENALQSKSQQDKSAGKAIKRRYWLIVTGVTVLFSGYSCFLALQSSIHVENGLGSKLTTITYVFQLSLNFLLIPFILRLIGAKKSLLLAESFYILYVIANAFSNEVFLIIGALAGGFAEALFWPPIGISFIYFAEKYSVHSLKTKEACVMGFSGIFFFMFQFNPVVGNIAGTVLLNLLNSEINNSIQNPINETKKNLDFFSSTHAVPLSESFALNYTEEPDSPIFNHVDYCGANDCQDLDIIDEAIDNYVPTNQIAIYALTAFFVFLMLLGMFSHVMLFPDMPFSDFNQKQNSKKSISNYDENETRLKNISMKKIIMLSLEAARDTFRQFFNPYQLFFITPYTAYTGFNLGFVLSEATRAYGSCLLGVNQVGICVAIFALTAALHCFMIGRFYGKWGRVPLLIFEVVYDLSLYTFLLVWKPTEETKWITYLIFSFLGIYNATNQMIVSNIFGCDFYQSKELSYNLWCIVFAIGFALQYGISTYLCVREKIYICMVWIVLGVALQLLFENCLKDKAMKKGSKRNKESEETNLKISEPERSLINN